MDILSVEDQERVVNAISVAESKTSGEIRLVVERSLKEPSALDAAIKFFKKLEMDRTSLRNGVLIYLAVDDHAFSIIGDKGINEKVAENFWEATKEQMVSFFVKGELTEGLIAGITHAGEQLQAFFPRRVDDINELPNDIYFGNR